MAFTDGLPLLPFLVWCTLATEACDTSIDLARLHTSSVTASSSLGAHTANLATDGDSSSRWESAFEDPQWIAVDLGASYVLCEVAIDWEPAYASSYQIQTSSDGIAWVTHATTGATGGGLVTTSVTDVEAQHVRMFGTERGTQYGYSIWTFSVYGNRSAAPASPSPAAPTSCASMPSPQQDTELDGTAAGSPLVASAGAANCCTECSSSLPGCTGFVLYAGVCYFKQGPLTPRALVDRVAYTLPGSAVSGEPPAAPLPPLS